MLLPKPMYLFLLVGIILAFTVNGAKESKVTYEIPFEDVTELVSWVVEESANHVVVSASFEGELSKSYIPRIVDLSKSGSVSDVAKGRIPVILSEKVEGSILLAQKFARAGYKPIVIKDGWSAWRDRVLNAKMPGDDLDESQWRQQNQMVYAAKFLKGELGAEKAPRRRVKKRARIRRVRSKPADGGC